MEDHITQLKTYIHEQLQAGFSPDVIAQHLRAANWSDADVQTGLRLAQAERQNTAATPEVQSVEQPATSEQQPAAAGTNIHTPQERPVATASVYLSNPFLNGMASLASLFSSNPVTTLAYGFFTFLGIAAWYALIMLEVFWAQNAVLAVLLVLVGIVAAVWWMGVTWTISLHGAQGQPTNLRQAVTSVNRKLLGFSGLLFLLIVLFVALGIVFGIVAALLLHTTPLLAPVVALLYVPLVVIWARIAYAPAAFLDSSRGIFGSIQYSLDLTKGRSVEVIGTHIAALFISGMGILAPTVFITVHAGRYRSLVTAHEGRTGLPAVHRLNYILALGALLLVIVAMLLSVIVAQSRPSYTPGNALQPDFNYYNSNLNTPVLSN